MDGEAVQDRGSRAEVGGRELTVVGLPDISRYASAAAGEGNSDVGIVELTIEVLRSTLAAGSVGVLVELTVPIVQERDYVVVARFQPGDLEESRGRHANELRLALEEHGAVLRTGGADADEDLLPSGNAPLDIDGAADDDFAQPEEGEELGAGREDGERGANDREPNRTLEHGQESIARRWYFHVLVPHPAVLNTACRSSTLGPPSVGARSVQGSALAGVVKLVYTPDLGSGAVRRKGSSPFSRIHLSLARAAIAQASDT